MSSPTTPATPSEVLGIFQREQEHAMFLLSLSPLLSSLFVSYANRAASHESASSTSAPSPENEEWKKKLQNIVAALREENGKLRSENREVSLKLETEQASQEGFRSHISSLEQVNAAQQNENKSLRKELVEARDLYEQVMKGWNAEKAAYQTRISGVEVGFRLCQPGESIVLIGKPYG
jgi:chromosome segregation ATPase